MLMYVYAYTHIYKYIGFSLYFSLTSFFAKSKECYMYKTLKCSSCKCFSKQKLCTVDYQKCNYPISIRLSVDFFQLVDGLVGMS